ncbi:tetraspanin-33-like [Rhinatrema bivittatum]|uniref:tetraspanin-33-like n=1 Tax=Rhinatrema bivittatum TaxID=194408 RepID=UPI00112BB024|nr:tetraspanin-33-like [Rhinatrema bivittatum]
MSKEANAVDSLITDPSVILITVGILMFAVTFLGCLGALRDLHILLKIFAWLMLLILVLQIVAAVLGFFFSGLVSKTIHQRSLNLGRGGHATFVIFIYYLCSNNAQREFRESI